MIKKIWLLLAAALAAFLLVAPAQAQSTRAQLNATYLNPCIFANVTGLISEACVYTLHANEIQSFGTLADTNVWTGLNTFADSGSWSSSGIGNAKALGVGETAPSSGNVNIAGQYQIGGSPLNFSNLAGNATTSQGGLYGATLNAIPYGGGAGALPSFASPVNNAVMATNGSGAPVETSAPQLGASGVAGSITFGNATSGLLTLAPVTGALGTVTASVPANTGVLAETNYTQTWTAQQFHGSGTAASNKLATYAYGTNGTPLVSLPTAGGGAITGASWSSLSSGGVSAQIGGIFWGFADKQSMGSGTGYDAWGVYGECRTYPSVTSYCATQENDVTNLSAATVDISPNAPFSAGADEALHLASGGGCTNAAKCYDPFNTLTDLVSRPASALLLLSANGTTANKGIVFDQAGITGADGTDTGGAATAIAFGRGQNQVWYDSNGNIKASIGSTLKTTDPNGLQLDFATGSGLIFANSNGQVFQVYPGASGSQTAEGVAVIGGNPGGGAPTIQATTTDAQSNLNLIVQGRGTGQVSISTGLTSTGTAPTCAVTGAGTGASCALAAGSNDVSGMMVISTGTSPSSSGNISLTLNSAVGAHQAGCMVSAANQGANWNNVSFIKTTVSQTLPVWFWSNNSVNLTASTSNAYGVEYHCIGY